MAETALYQDDPPEKRQIPAAAMDVSARGPDTPIETVFFRDLAEVYLLIDHLSSQADKCLPARLDVYRDGKLDCGDWIARICEITWPPKGNQQAVARDAEILITTRDALNRLAAPATGATIAFTRMVVDSDLAAAQDLPQTEVSQNASAKAKQPAPQRRWPPPGGSNLPQRRRTVRNPDTGLTRYDLATRAFPELAHPAEQFARFYRKLIRGLFVSLLLVLSLSWYVATGNDLLRQVHKARFIFQGPEASAQGPEASAKPAPPPTSPEQQQYRCDRYVAAGTNMARWAPPWPEDFYPPRPCISINHPHNSVAVAPDPHSSNDLDSQLWGAALVNVLGNKVLPACYGLLGAWAAVLRGLSASIQKSELARRHRMISLVKLALGIVIGACIGLFVTPVPNDGDAGQNPAGLLGTANIPFAALSFLAGYGVEHVFPLLDGLLGRVFTPLETKKTA